MSGSPSPAVPCVALVIPSLGAGGAERVISGMANYWAKAGWNIHLLTLAGEEIPAFYPLSPQVRLHRLNLFKTSANLWEAIGNNLRRLTVLRRTIAGIQPDTVISFIDQTNILTLAATIGMPVPVIVSERIYPGILPLSGVWDRLRRLLYPRAFAVVNQTRRGHNWFGAAIQAKGRVIPNHVETYPPHESLYTAPTVVGTGRLTDQKDFPTLLRAFALIREKHPEWRLVIWGEGPERPRLEQLRDELGLQDVASLPGLSPSPGQWLNGAGIFVLSSKVEGFPNVLLEAMHTGLPVISTNCPAGPDELIEDGENGLLVPMESPEQLATALDRAISEPAFREKLGVRAAETSRCYNPDQIMALWSDLVMEAARNGHD